IILLIVGSSCFGLPVGGIRTAGKTFASEWARWIDIGRHLILPTITLTIIYLGEYLLIMRSSLLEVLGEDYILTASWRWRCSPAAAWYFIFIVCSFFAAQGEKRTYQKQNPLPLLDIRNLTTEFITDDGAALRAVEDVSFTLERGEALGIVGESGCGKTTAMLSLLRLLPHAGRIAGGQVLFDGEDLLPLSPAEFRERRWRDMAMVFQGAMNALNPVRTIGDQVREAIITHLPWPRERVDKRVSELLELVGIPSWRAAQYP